MINKNLLVVFIALLTFSCCETYKRSAIQTENFPKEAIVKNVIENEGGKQTVFFDTNSSELTSGAVKNLDKNILPAIRNSRPSQIRIEGYCDERGKVEYNKKLGKKRAEAVKNYLVKNGIDSAKIKTVSYGKSNQIDLGHDEAAWAKNRRAVTITY